MKRPDAATIALLIVAALGLTGLALTPPVPGPDAPHTTTTTP